MKKSLVSLALALFALTATGQTDKFTKAMEAALAGLDTTRTATGWVEKGNAFERIAAKEPGQWLPHYYAGFCQTQAFNFEKDPARQQALVEKADRYLALADSLAPQNPEVFLAKSMAAGLHIRLNPMANGQKYGMLASLALEKAKQLDPANPRTSLQEGMTLFFTPEQWGGDKKRAKELFEEAAAKFEAFKPASAIHPDWGRGTLNYMVSMK